MARRRAPALAAPWRLWALGLESAAVVGLRSLRIAAGGAAAQREMGRMVSEKLLAAMELQAKALTGGLSGDAMGKSVAHYRCKVRANRKRLGR